MPTLRFVTSTSPSPKSGLRRRIPLVAIGIVAVVAVGLVWWSNSGGGNQTIAPAAPGTGAVPPIGGSSPATLVRIDDAVGIEVLDDAGLVVSTIAGASTEQSLRVVGGGLLVDSKIEEGVVLFYDVRAGTQRYADTEMNRGVAILFGDDLLVVADPTDGPAVVIEATTGSARSVAAGLGFDPDTRYAGAFPNAERDTVVLTPSEGENLSSAVIPADGLDAGWAASGVVNDVRAGVALVVDPHISRTGELHLESRDGPIGRAIVIDGSFAGGAVVAEASALVVTRDGHLLDIEASAGAATDIGMLDVGGVDSVRRVWDDRVFVVGSSASVLIDHAGAVLRRWEQHDGESVGIVDRGTRCAVVQPGGAGGRPGVGTELIDLATGTTFADVPAAPTPLYGDGCSLAAPGDAPFAVVDGEVVEVADPDVHQVLAADAGSRRLLVTRGAAGELGVLDIDSGGIVDLPAGDYRFVP